VAEASRRHGVVVPGRTEDLAGGEQRQCLCWVGLPGRGRGTEDGGGLVDTSKVGKLLCFCYFALLIDTMTVHA